MASKSASKGDRLPFEPAPKKRKKESATDNAAAAKSAPSRPKQSKQKQESKPKITVERKAKGASARGSAARKDSAIPEEISQRMIKRMALWCGVPTSLGILTFIVSYLIVINEIVDLPPVAVLLVSLGFFGLGVLGLSYGALSTSWEEGGDDGSVLGVEEFKVNFGRMRQAWRDSRNHAKS